MSQLFSDVISRKILPAIFVVDTSESMDEEKIACVNDAMRECIRILQKIVINNVCVDIKIAIMTFGSEVTWITNGLEELENYSWNDVSAYGTTKLSVALNELTAKMCREELFNNEVGFKRPIVILVSDGRPTDDYKKVLSAVSNENKWFKVSAKIVIAIGNDARTDMLAEVTGNIESIFGSDKLNDLEAFLIDYYRVIPNNNTPGVLPPTDTGDGIAVFDWSIPYMDTTEGFPDDEWI